MEQYINYGIIAIYMLVIIGVGFFFSNRHETTENYLLGGRNMPVVAIGISMLMTLFSSISLTQVPGEIVNHGWTLFSLGYLTLFMAIPYYLLFVRFYFKLGSFTPYEYLEYRYDRTVRLVVASAAFYTRTMYLGTVLYTSSKIFEGAYQWPAWITILLVGLIGILYTVMGGIKAVVWTDVIQFVVLFGGLFFILYILNKNIDGGLVGGVVFAFENGHGASEYLSSDFYKLTPYVRLCFWLMLWNALFTCMGDVSSDQLNIQRILSTKDWKAGFKSQVLSTTLAIVVSIILEIVGFAIYTYYTHNPDPLLTAGTGDLALFRFIATKMPMPIPGIFMAAMLAAIMSTLDSGMNSMATVWLKEFHSKFIRKNMTSDEEVRVSRVATIAVGVFAVLLGLGLNFCGQWLQQSVTEIWTILTLLGTATLPAFLFAVLSKRANSVLVWAYCFFAIGESVGKNIWYVLSRKAVQAWSADPGIGLGWGGKLDGIYVWVPLLIGVVLLLPWILCRSKRNFRHVLPALAGMFILGITFYNAIWFVYSHICVVDKPLECSFAFFLPCSLIVAFIALWFCPVQPEHKWRGLTLATVDDPVVGK